MNWPKPVLYPVPLIDAPVRLSHRRRDFEEGMKNRSVDFIKARLQCVEICEMRGNSHLPRIPVLYILFLRGHI